MLLLLLLLVIPMLFIARYDVPAADDFSFSCETRAAVLNGGSLSELLSEAAWKTKSVYQTWQGSFSAVFLMALQPSIWGFEHYGITAWVMVLSLLCGTFFFFHRLFSGIFHIRKICSAIAGAAVSAACLQFLPSPNQSFYWYNGAVYYTFTFAVMLVLFAVIIGFLLYGGWIRIVAGVLLCILIGGSNYVTALFTCISGALLLIALAIRKDRRSITLLIPYAFLILCFALSIAAPGNAVRQDLNPDHPGALSAVFLSFRSAFGSILRWTDLRYAALMLFLCPVLWAGAKQSDASFPLPGGITALSFCLFASLFTPHLFALGSDGPERLLNILYFSFLVFSAFNLFWWLGWLQRKKGSKTGKDEIPLGSFCIFSASAALCLLCSVLFFHGTLTSVAAISELRSGEAAGYYAQAEARQSVLEDPAVTDCEFEPYVKMPYILYFTDMTDNPDSYENQDTAHFYGKNSIVVRKSSG